MLDLHNMTIAQIRELLDQDHIEAVEVKALSEDPRIGVRRLLEQYQKRKQRQQHLKEQWERMTIVEQSLKSQDYTHIAGMDEVGRGPLAGPVVAAAVILPDDFYLPGLNDSKKLSPHMRESFYHAIVEKAIAYCISFVDAETIDQINILQATLKVMRESVKGLDVKPDICLVDGLRIHGLEVEQLPLVGGDGKSVSIAAASILAKVTRDRWMTEAHEKYPMYGFKQHVGYGTAEHIAAIAKYGPCPLHRKTFGGVKEWVGMID